MNKKPIIILICLLIFAFAGIFIFKLWNIGAFVFDHSAEVNSNLVKWNGKEYIPISGEYSESRTIAKGSDGDWVLNSVKEDESHTFIVARSFLDQYLMVSADYIVPTSGNLTTVSWNGIYISDPEFLNAVSKIEAEKKTSFTYETDGIYVLTEAQHMRSLYFAYENCPVTTNYKGYMGKVNGEWVITTHVSDDQRSEEGSPKSYSVSCYKIPSEYWSVLSKYLT